MDNTSKKMLEASILNIVINNLISNIKYEDHTTQLSDINVPILYSLQ